MDFTLGKNKKLKSRKVISQLFVEGNMVKSFPLKMIFLPIENEEDAITKVAFSVPKRNFKHAVDRNRIKRLLRESYRLNQQAFFEGDKSVYHVMFIYMSREMPTQQQIDLKLKKLFSKFNSSKTSSKV